MADARGLGPRVLRDVGVRLPSSAQLVALEARVYSIYMASEAVHIFKNRLDRHLNIYLLFIPILIFVLVLTLFVSFKKTSETASTVSPDILGTEANP